MSSRLGARLPRSYFSRDVLEVAPQLLGTLIRRDDVVLRITEVEAYKWPGDTACHARAGKTPRTEALWGPPGRAYVYLCYGMHQMLNVVTGASGDAQAVLIRSCEAVRGLETIRARRAGKVGPSALSGPGKVGQALAVDTSWTHHPFHTAGGLTIHAAAPPDRVVTGKRIGIDFADPEHVALPWRYAAADNRSVSHRRALDDGEGS